MTTWPPDAWKIGGGTVWGWISYDPELDLIYLRHGESRARGIPSCGPATTSGRPASSRATRTPARRAGSTSMSPHDLHDYDGINEQRPARSDRSTASRARCSSAPDRNGYIYVHRSHDRRGAVRRAVRPRQLDQRRRPEDRPPDRQSGQGAAAPARSCATSARRASGRQGLAAVGVLAAHRAAVHPAQQSLHGRGRLEANYIAGTPYVGANVRMYPGPGGHRGEFTAWDLAKAARRSGSSREVPRLERRARDGRRCGVLRHHGGLVQGGGRPDRRAALAVQDRLRDHRPADHLPRAGRASSTSRSCPASAAGPAPIVSGDLDPRDATAALGFANAMKDLQGRTTQGGHAVCLPLCPEACAPCAGLLARWPLAFARPCARAPRASCASAPTRTTCRSRTSAAKASRTGSRRWSRASSARPSLHLVGAAPRLHPQHAEGRRLRLVLACRTGSTCCARRSRTTARPTSS